MISQFLVKDAFVFHELDSAKIELLRDIQKQDKFGGDMSQH